MKPEVQTPSRTILVTGASVERRLEQLGTNSSLLREAVEAGYRERSFTTENDARAAPGFIGWNGTVRALREAHQGLGTGWKRDQRNGRGLVCNESLHIEIEPQTGDENTGTKRTPKTKSSKGISVQNDIRRQSQGWFNFIDDPGSEGVSAPTGATIALWVLLFHCDEAARKLRLELSRPKHVTESGHICDWWERIIIDPIDLNEDAAVPDPSEDPDPRDEITIDIPMRSR